MPRAVRLLALMQLLRNHRRPIPAQQLARKLDVSIRSIYRDIAALQAEGAAIEGEAGSGYRLRPGGNARPLIFSPAELDALAQGARLVMAQGETALASAASVALHKITAIRPQSATGAPPCRDWAAKPLKRWEGGPDDPPALRKALRGQRKLSLRYSADNGSQRLHVVWPIALGNGEAGRVLAAWCETCQEFCHFRLGRMAGYVVQRNQYPAERSRLLRDWIDHLEIDIERF